MKMALTGVVMVMPGGILFLLVWATARALRAHLKAARAPGAPADRVSLWKALTRIRIGDVWREARQMSGIPSARAA